MTAGREPSDRACSDEGRHCLRIYADFNSVSPDGWCWCLRHQGVLLDDVAAELGLTDGQTVVVYYEDASEEFEFDAVLSQRNGRWRAKHDLNTYRLLRSTDV